MTNLDNFKKFFLSLNAEGAADYVLSHGYVCPLKYTSGPTSVMGYDKCPRQLCYNCLTEWFGQEAKDDGQCLNIIRGMEQNDE